MIKRLWDQCIRCYRWPYRLWYFPRGFWRFLKELRYFLKYGYPREAVYENYQFFIDTQRQIFTEYLENHFGYPGRYEAETNEGWEAIVRHMIELLNAMDEQQYDGSLPYYEENKKIEQAKNEFFELYSKWFFDLWD